MPRKKTEEIAIVPDTPVLPADDAVEESLPELMSEPVTEDITPEIVESPAEEPEAAPETPPKRTVRRRTTTRKKQPAEEPETPPAEDTTEEPVPDTVQPWEILTVDARDEAETQEQREDIIWHEIHTGYRTRRILTGMLSGIEKTDAGRTIAIVDYKGFRIVIPLREMVLDFPKGLYGIDYDEMILNYQKILNKMLGAEVDFVIKGIDGNSRSVVASRKDAMLKKQQIYYFGTDSDGQYRIYAGRVVQARVIAVSERVIRVEVFGVETSILSRDLSWDWIGDANDRFSVGDHVLVRVLEVDRTDPEQIRIKADVKSVTGDNRNDNAVSRASTQERSPMSIKALSISDSATAPTPSPTPAMTGADPDERMMSVSSLLIWTKNAVSPQGSSPESSSSISDLSLHRQRMATDWHCFAISS